MVMTGKEMFPLGMRKATCMLYLKMGIVRPSSFKTWAVAGVLLNMVALGMVLSFPSSLLPALREPDSVIKTDLQTASWLASSIGVACIPGFFLSSFLMDKWGRRMAHGLVILPGVLGWILVYFATNVTTLMIGRILGGITGGATISLGAVVIGEFTHPKHRGMFLNLKTASVCFGGMVVHILSNLFFWRSIALMALILPVLSLFIIYTWPESPAWLASQKRFKDCENAFFWLRGKSDYSLKEVDDLIKAQINDISISDKDSMILSKTILFFKKFTKKDFLKPVFIIFLGSFLLEVSGRHIFPVFAFDIIGEITGNRAESFYYILAIDIIITSSAMFSSVLVKLLKRRTLLFSTGFSGLAVLACACTYLYLASAEVISKDRVWIPLSMFVLYFILTNLGCTPIPLALLGEIFPLAHRAAGSVCAGISLSISVYLALQVTPIVLTSIKVYGMFAVFGIISLVILCILFFILPETKDRTLLEIEEYFNYGRFKDDDIKKDEEAAIKILGKDVIIE